jgi:hypothetical protein
LAISKEEVRKFDVERFNLRILSYMEDRKQFPIKISKMFAAFEKLSVSEDIMKA